MTIERSSHLFFIMSENKTTFASLGIKDSILKLLTKLKLDTPTPIQEQAIKPILEGHDLVGIAQTGTGKTLAFAIPMLERLSISKGRGLVVVPTRELASQVAESIKEIGSPFGLRTAVLIGGEYIQKQFFTLRKKPHIIIATPGRLIDHLKRNTLSLKEVKMIVLDEADMMFDLGFAPQMEEILKLAPKDRQTLLFSATMPSAIFELSAKHLKLPIKIEIAPQGTTAETVEQEVIIIKGTNRFACLQDIIKKNKGSILVFVRTKRSVSDLTKRLVGLSHSADEIHSNLSQARRKKTLDSFRAGKLRILVATDVAARGLDIKGIELVVNYNLPDANIDYVHRIGRTGRAGVAGKAISLATLDQLKNISAIEKLINKEIIVSSSTYSITKEEKNKAEKAKPKPRRFKTRNKKSLVNKDKRKHSGHNNRGRKERAKRFKKS